MPVFEAAVFPKLFAVIRSDDDRRVVIQASVAKRIEEASDLLVHVGDFAEICGPNISLVNE